MKFIYVVGYLSPEDPKTLAFVHFFVDAEDEQDAYGVGMETHDDTIEGKLVNNYVIPVPVIYAMEVGK